MEVPKYSGDVNGFCLTLPISYQELRNDDQVKYEISSFWICREKGTFFLF
jgi:hypothetical protein